MVTPLVLLCNLNEDQEKPSKQPSSWKTKNKRKGYQFSSSSVNHTHTHTHICTSLFVIPNPDHRPPAPPLGASSFWACAWPYLRAVVLGIAVQNLVPQCVTRFLRRLVAIRFLAVEKSRRVHLTKTKERERERERATGGKGVEVRKEFIKVGFSVCLVEYLVVVASLPCWVVSSSLSYLALFVDIIAFFFVCPLPPPQPAGLGLANITTTTPCILRSTASRRRQRSCTRHPSVPYCLIPSLLHCTALHE